MRRSDREVLEAFALPLGAVIALIVVLLLCGCSTVRDAGRNHATVPVEAVSHAPRQLEVIAQEPSR